MAQTEPIQNILNFGGLVTNTTPDKIPDRNATDVRNIDFSLNGTIQSARGYELYGNKITAPGACVDSFLYQKNFGTLKRIKIRTRDNGTSVTIDWLNPSNISGSTDGYWETLKAGLTTGAKTGFASANGDGGAKVNKLIIGNAYDTVMVWNGSTATVDEVTTNTIVCNETLLSEGFDAVGKVLINGTEYTYTGITDKTFTGVTPDPTGVVLENNGVSQLVDSSILAEHIILKQTTIAFVHNQPFSNDTITDSANGFSTAGFTAGQKIAVVGSSENLNNRVYTIKTVADGVLTLSDTDVVVGATAGDIITIAAGCPKGNILLTAQRKLFLSGVLTNESKVYYSESGEVTSFGITSGLGSGGSFDLMEGGGPITCMDSKGKNTIVIHKRDAIIAYTRDNDGTNAIESFDTLSTGFDSGATSYKAKTAINKTSYFMTGIEGAKRLDQIISEGNLSLPIESITDIIMPTLQGYNNSNVAMTFLPSKKLLLIATNDSDGVRKQISIYVKGASNQPVFDISIDDIPVADYIVDGSDIFFVSTLDQNCYRLFGRNSANGNVLNHRYVTKEYIFDSPAQQKQFDTVYIEGLINANGKLRVSVDYGIFGQDGSKSFIIKWDNSDIVSTATVSALGTGVLGATSLGASDSEIQNSYIFSCPIHFDVLNTTRYRVKFETVYDDESDYDHETYWAVMNCSSDTRLFDISRLNMQNSNDVSGTGVGGENVGYSIS